MANRTFMDANYSLVKRMVHLFGAVSVGAAGAVTLQKWNYPQLGGGGSASRTYTAAPSATAVPAGTGPWPAQYTAGSEGIFSVTRTGTGLWTFKLQDNYQRCLQVFCQQSLSGGLGNIVTCHQDSAVTNMATGGGSVIGVALESSTATAADPASGSVVLLTFILADATEP